MKQRIEIDHIGIATNSLDEGSKFWKLLGLQSQGDDEFVEDQGVTTRFFPLSKSITSAPNIELLEPSGPDTPIGKLENRICVKVEPTKANEINVLILSKFRCIEFNFSY